MIVTTGATGHLGRGVVEHLLTLLPAAEIAVSVRDPARAADLAERGVRVRRGDFAEPGGLAEAFAGARVLLVVSSNAAAYGGDPLAQHRAAVAAAREAGVDRIVYTSHQGASATSAFPPCRSHAATEVLLADSGLAWTALRHGFYASTAAAIVGDAAATGVMSVPPDGPVSWTTTADLAVADAEILAALHAGEAGFDGPTAPLTATEAHDADALARTASDLLGRAVRRETPTMEEAAAALADRGLPGAVAMTLAIHEAARAGELAATDPLLARLLGREPTTVREVLAEHLAVG